jgi:hypothetical protein
MFTIPAMYLCALYDSQEKERLLPYMAITGFCSGDAQYFLRGMNRIFKHLE